VEAVGKDCRSADICGNSRDSNVPFHRVCCSDGEFRSRIFCKHIRTRRRIHEGVDTALHTDHAIVFRPLAEAGCSV
jgi:hypothetical protein